MITTMPIPASGIRHRATKTPSPVSSIPTTGTSCCSARFGGVKTCHCTECHATFTTPSAFDKHRTGSHASGTRTCLPPIDAGLTDAGRAYPCWSHPGREGDE